ncbi:MAG: biotin--[acetyl-CoA-carboxylase] ligase [Dehalococcoidia bacterium]|nr:biotin--[acetyl-CoA-carboxylase] ligase [Dehalococcoidia bacterium]
MPFDLDRYQQLRTSTRAGAEVHYVEHTGSTMDDARAGASSDGVASCGRAYVAGEQSAGRGRQGRTWVSAAAAGLYATYHLCPPSIERAPLLSIAGAVAALEAIEATSGLRLELKWPNDVLHEGRKLCGVLAESRIDGGRVDAFLGVGINLRSQPDLPPEVHAIATSIEAAGSAVLAREDLLAALSTALEPRVEQAAGASEMLLADWRARLGTLGRRVALATPSGAVDGEAVDITASGELVLRLDDGSTRAFAAGDVTTARPHAGEGPSESAGNPG